MKFQANLNSLETWVALTQQEYLTNNPNGLMNKIVSRVITEYEDLHFPTTQKPSVQIYARKDNKLQLLYQGHIKKIPGIYSMLKILPWNEEIKINLKPLTLYLFVRYDQDKIDEINDMLDRAWNEEQEEDKMFRLFSRKRKF